MYKRQVRFSNDPNALVSDLMTRDVVTVKHGVSEDEARSLLHKFRIERLVVVDDNKKCVGLVTVKDMEKAESVDRFFVSRVQLRRTLSLKLKLTS